MYKFLFKIFRKAWLKFFALVLIFAISITCFAMLYSTNEILKENVAYFETTLNQEDFKINAMPNSQEVIDQIEPFNEDMDIKSSEEIVAEMAAKYNFTYEEELSATVKAENEYEYQPWTIMELSSPSGGELSIDGVTTGTGGNIEEVVPEITIKFTEETTEIGKSTYVEGNSPTKDNQIAIPEHFAKAYDLHVGDKYNFNGATYEISGIFIASSYPIIASPTDMIETLDTYTIVYATENTINNLIDSGADNVTPALAYKATFNDTTLSDSERLAIIEDMSDDYPAYQVQVPKLDANGDPVLEYETQEIKTPVMTTIQVPDKTTCKIIPPSPQPVCDMQTITVPAPKSNDPSFAATYQEGLTKLATEGEAFFQGQEWLNYFAYESQFVEIPVGVVTENAELPMIYSISDKSAIVPINAIPMRIEMVDTMNKVMYGVFTSIVTVMMVLIISKILYSRRKDIGVLIAFGYSPKQIRKALLIIPITLSLLASILGLVLAIGPSMWFMQIFDDFFALPLNTLQIITPKVFTLSVIIPTVITTIATYFFATKIINRHVVDLLNNAPKEKRISWLSSHFSTMISKMKFSSKLRTRSLLSGVSKMFLLFVGVVVSTFMLIMVFLMVDAMANTINSVFEAIGSPYVSVYKEPHTTDEFDESMAMFTIGTVQSADANNAPEDAKEITATDEKQLFIVGITEDTTLVNASDEYLTEMENGIVLPYQYGETYGLSEGDTITVKDPVTNQTFTLNVAGIQGTDSGPYAYVSIDIMQEAYGYDSNQYNAQGFDTKPPTSDDVLLTVESETLKATVKQTLAILYIMIGFIALFAMLILIPIILVISSIIVDDNIKNIAVLKAFGYKDRKIRSMLINIYTPILILGLFVGAIIGIFFNEWLIKVMSDSMGMAMPAVYKPSSFIISFIIVIVIYALGIWISGLKLKKIQVSELLKDSE